MNYNPSSFTGYGIPISPQGTTPIQPVGGANSLMAFLMQLLQKKNGPSYMGTNRIPIDQNQVTSGYLDRMGVYHSGEQ